MNKSLKVLIVEDDSLPFSQIVKTMFQEETESKEMSIISTTTNEADKFLRALQHARNIDLIILAAGVANIDKITKFVSMARFGFEKHEAIIGVSNYSNYKEILLQNGCTFSYSSVEACKFLSDFLEIKLKKNALVEA